MSNGEESSQVERPKCSKTIQTKLKRSLLSKGVSESSRQKCVKNVIGIKKISSLKEDWSCNCQKVSWENYPNLKYILPPGYDYRVCSYHGDTEGFKSMLRLPHLTSEKVVEWKSQLENTSFCLFRVCRTFPGSGRYNTFKTDYSCQHNASRGTGKLATKKTGCKAELSITVKRVVKKSRSRDKHLPELPTTIFLRWYHNHPLDAVESMRFCDVSEDTTKELVTLYNQGYSPASAYLYYRSKLMKERGESFDTIVRDRRVLPEKQYVYRLFAKMKKKKEGHPSNGVPASVFEAVSPRQPVDVVLPAAGKSTRMGIVSSVPKQFQKVLGTHLIAYTIACFHRLPWIRHIVLVVSATQEPFAMDLMREYGWSKVKVCTGSESRHRSIRNGIEALKDDCVASSVVVIHDGARPFVPEDILENVAKMAEKHGAAGVVRPLVSTVIKPDNDNVLESTLTRCDYRNSEMPQAFQYGIIAKAYDKCSDHDLDHGTECLLLALHYADCPAHLVEGCPDLWKVTYAKDLFTMESVVKEKCTRVWVVKKSHCELDYLDKLKSGLEERQMKLCGSEKDKANTFICFVDLAPFSTSSSTALPFIPPPALDWAWIKQVSWKYNTMTWLERRLGLFVILVFLPGYPCHHTPSVTDGMTTSTPSSMHTAKLSHESQPQFHMNQHNDLIQNTLQALPHQQQQHLHVQQQQPLQHHLHESMVISNPAPPPPQVLDHCGEDGHPDDHMYSFTPSFSTQSQYLDNADFHQTFTMDSGSHNNNHHHLHPTSSSLAPRLMQHHHQYLQQQQQQLLQDTPPHPCHTYTPLHNVTISNNLLSGPNSFTQLHHNPLKANSLAKQSLNSVGLDGQGTTSWQFTSNTQGARGSNPNRDEEIGRGLPQSLLPLCQEYMQQFRQRMKESTPELCITSILSGVGTDLTDKLVEVVWSRSQFLDGQVLMMD